MKTQQEISDRVGVTYEADARQVFIIFRKKNVIVNNSKSLKMNEFVNTL